MNRAPPFGHHSAAAEGRDGSPSRPPAIGWLGEPALPSDPPDQLTEPTGRLSGVVATGLQEGENLGLAGEGGEVGGRRAALVGERVGTGIEEQGGDLDVTFEGHAAQRRLSLVIAQVDRGAGIQQQLHDLGPAMVAGQHQERVALGVACIDRLAALQQGAQAGGIATTGQVSGGVREDLVGGC
jgi:hypothetical protein